MRDVVATWEKNGVPYNAYVASNVQCLDASCQFVDDERLAVILSSLAHECSHVYLWDNRIGDRGFCTLIDAATMRNMKVLWMGHNLITSSGLSHLCTKLPLGAWSRVEQLFLDDNDICDRGVFSLSESCQKDNLLPQLVRLGLHTNRIGTDGADAIAYALQCNAWPNLRVLWLNNNQIRNAERIANVLTTDRLSLAVDVRTNPLSNGSVRLLTRAGARV